MRPDDLPRALARQIASLYVIHGDEALLALEAAQGDDPNQAAKHLATATEIRDCDELQQDWLLRWMRAGPPSLRSM